MIDLLIIVLLVLLNGVFALSEMSIVSARKSALRSKAEGGSVGAKTALRMLEDPSKLLSTVQIGITLIGVVAGAYGATALSGDVAPLIRQIAPGLADSADGIAFGIVIVLTTLLSLLLGELVPKRIALAAPERFAIMMAPPMALLEMAVSPLVWLLRTLTEGLLRLLGLNRTRQDDVTEEELQSLIDEGEKVGIIDAGEREMIEGVMRLADRSVRAIMTPRPDIVWLDPSMARDQVLAIIAESRHSRFPVAEGAADHIVGVVQTKDLLTHLAEKGELDLRAVMHEPNFVPETMPVLNLLGTMRGNPVRMSFVADEYGALLGLVTVADLIESIVGGGALGDEDGISQPVKREDGSWLVDGMTPIDEFEQLVAVKGLDEGEGFSTVAGLVMHLARAVPKEGDRVERWPLVLEVVDMDGRRIDKVIVRRAEGDEASTG